MKILLTACTLGILVSCSTPQPETGGTPAKSWALAIHGGAGVISRDSTPDDGRQHREALERALAEGRRRLSSGDTALDVVEHVVRMLEDEPLFNAGKGAVFTAEGVHELDASIMDGRQRACGAVTGVRTVRHPISLARRVMETSPHVFFAGAGAEAFADTTNLERVPNEYFDTDARRAALEGWRASQRSGKGGGTVGCVARDVSGHLAAATSTGGMTGKRFGRVGDSPVVGAGTYASDGRCAVSCTGTGEQFLRHTIARDVAARLEYAGLSLEAAARAAMDQLDPDDGGLIAVGADGAITLIYNTNGMFRGAADSAGRFEVAIWEN